MISSVDLLSDMIYRRGNFVSEKLIEFRFFLGCHWHLDM
jgi:hypothetical protein